MNCCDYNCKQGRNCPARATPVASIGRKDYARAELPPSTWRHQLRRVGKLVLFVISMLFYAALLSAVIRNA